MNAPRGKRVFLSYSSRDKAAADAICAALERADLSCWIAPRDLSAGTQWGGGIVEAVEQCQVVLVVFSSASNDSPQVAREMELAASGRKPIIPVRIEDLTPSKDMQYFLGLSHWFNAFPKPIETYLPDIVTATGRVLQGERRPWVVPTPKGRRAQAALMVGVAALVALGVAMVMRPHLPGPMESPLAGIWKTSMPDGRGGKSDCVMNVAKSGATTFSDSCPLPFSDSSGALTGTKDATFAPQLFQPGDTGSALFQGGAANGYAFAYKLGFFGGLTTRDSRFGALSWSHASASSKPAQDPTAAILPSGSSWPASDTAGIATRATAYIHSKWQADAVLMSMDLKSDATSGVSVNFTFYSPSQQQSQYFQPGMPGGGLMAPTAQVLDTRQALPHTFSDLPAAIDQAHQRGMQGKQISEAKLEWSGGPSCGTGVFALDNAILPKCPPHRFVGIQWQINSAIGETFYVPAN